MKRIAAALGVSVFAVTLVACSAGDTPRRAVARTTTTTTVIATTTTATTLPPPDFAATTSDDPTRVAAGLAAAERITVDPPSAIEAVRDAALALQLGYRKMAQLDVGREQAVAAALPDDATRRALANNVAAARYLFALAGTSTPKPAPPAEWLIVAPAPAEELIGYYRAAESETGVPWQILASVHFVETKLGRIRGTSSAGAQGPMQFMPATWKAYGQGDINSNRDAIASAARYLRANGAPERLDDALYRYNHSKNYVAAIKAYAQRITDDERSFRGYHQWQVLYRTSGGTLLLPEGWPAVPARNVAA